MSQQKETPMSISTGEAPAVVLVRLRELRGVLVRQLVVAESARDRWVADALPEDLVGRESPATRLHAALELSRGRLAAVEAVIGWLAPSSAPPSNHWPGLPAGAVALPLLSEAEQLALATLIDHLTERAAMAARSMRVPWVDGPITRDELERWSAELDRLNGWLAVVARLVRLAAHTPAA